ncbi:PTS lactose/cellobiose transporter subunit IIA [Fusibacter sp. Q10-2]|uniref:PTS lactose/cellobiose transporter subunit IIA n=2 Tax=Fusibacter ferrireducens TaxID=2785058 RepID=A0ABR9ZWE5_9FIRM|nr:PTS lactose/cellobiose transporter subunit IIA [Fusibacter ferrireducens]
MIDEKYEEVVMGLIVSSGDARSLAMEAIQAAKAKAFDKANALMAECEIALTKAHNIQTELIQKEIRGEHVQIMLLMVHAQDHLMNAIVVKEMAMEIIELHHKIE